MKPISSAEIETLKNAVQHFKDCYLVASVSALSRSSNGRKILAQNILHTNNGYKIRFNNINGKNHDFFVTQKEMDDLVYLDKYQNPVILTHPHNPIIKAIEVAMNKLLEKYPSKKPWICRFPSCNEKFEFNKPSNFLEMFTGKTAFKLNEDGLRLHLKSKARESKDIFDKISDEPNSSFVAGTSIGFRKGMSDNHCYTITSVDKKAQKIELFEHRFLESLTLTYEEAIKNLKFIVGYFDKNLK